MYFGILQNLQLVFVTIYKTMQLQCVELFKVWLEHTTIAGQSIQSAHYLNRDPSYTN